MNRKRLLRCFDGESMTEIDVEYNAAISTGDVVEITIRGKAAAYYVLDTEWKVDVDKNTLTAIHFLEIERKGT